MTIKNTLTANPLKVKSEGFAKKLSLIFKEFSGAVSVMLTGDSVSSLLLVSTFSVNVYFSPGSRVLISALVLRQEKKQKNKPAKTNTKKYLLSLYPVIQLF